MKMSVATVVRHLAGTLRPCLPAAALLLLAVPAAAGGRLYFTDVFNPTFSDGYVRSCKTDGTDVRTLAAGYSGLRGIAVDAEAGKVYWTDVDSDVIRRANLDGTDMEDLVTTGMLFPMSIDLYDGGGRIVFGDQSSDYVAHASLDGFSPSVIRTTTFHAAVAIDETNKHIYWTETVDATRGFILRMDVNTGMNFVPIVEQYGKPSRLALDVDGGKIYWTDYVQDVVRRANLDGTSVEVLYDVGANLNPGGIALDLGDGKVYWGQSTSTNRMKIMRMNLDGSNPEDVAYGFGSIVEIDFVPDACEGDLDGDNLIGFGDLLHVLSNWAPCP